MNRQGMIEALLKDGTYRASMSPDYEIDDDYWLCPDGIWLSPRAAYGNLIHPEPFNRPCPDCHGAGGETHVILDDGTGPWTDCNFCQGTGRITNRGLYYMTLGYLSQSRRKR